MYYADDFYKEFKKEIEFHEWLYDVGSRAEWVRESSKKLKILETSEGEALCTPIEDADMEQIMDDTRKNAGLYLQYQNKVVPIGMTAIGTLKARARINGNALSDVTKQVLADILNECLKVSKGDALLRIFEGKVRAVLSGDQKDYAIIEMPDLFMVASAYVNDYRENEFLYGYVDHYIATLAWKIADDKLTKAYKDLLEQHGRKQTGDLSAYIRVTTSDVGASGANIFYSLWEGGHTVVLGEAMKIRHEHSNGIEDFTSNMEHVFDYYKEILNDMGRLYDIHISYPANAMARVMNKQGFSKKLIGEAVENFKTVFGEKPCTAYEVYCGICESIFLAKRDGGNIKAMIQLEEKAARCISIRWHDYDIPGDFTY